MMASITPQQAAALVENEKAVLIDVREPEEFIALHIPGAKFAPLSVLPLLPMEEDRDRPAIFFCNYGNRTKEATTVLASRGYTATYYLDGGIQAWKTANLPVRESKTVTLPIMRQVQMVAGGIVAVSVLLSGIMPFFSLVAFAVGAGLVFAGWTGNCMMARLLMQLPWNKK